MNTQMRNYIAIFALLAGTAMLNACMIGGELKKEVDNINSIGKDEVLIVGRVDLVPGLKKGEQRVEAGGIDVMGFVDMHKGRAMLQVNKTAQLNEEYKAMLNPKLGKTFYFKIARNEPYIVSGNILVEHWFKQVGSVMVGNQMHAQLEQHKKEVIFPGKFKIDIRPNDKAIYIGTLRYYRDEFNSVTKVRLLDDYKRTNRQFRKKFGKKYKLRRALLKRVK